MIIVLVQKEWNMLILLSIICMVVVFFIGADIFSLADEIGYCASKDIDVLKRKYSTCRECGHRLRLKDTFPVVSRFINKGKCRFCDASFSKRGFFTELSGGFFALFVYLIFYYIIKMSIFMSAGLMIIISIFCMLVIAFIYAKPYLKNKNHIGKNEDSKENNKESNIEKSKESKKESNKDESIIDEIPKIDLF